MEQDHKDYKIYTYRSEFDKALHTLEGMLKGISIDRELNHDEIYELINWCNLYKKFLKNNPFNELIPLIERSVDDNYLSQDEIEDILWVCDNFKTGNIYYDVVTSDIQRLQGILHGILSDNCINDKEIENLQNWILENEHLSGTYPYDEVYSLIMSVLSDGRVDESERKALKVFFSEFIDTTTSYNINRPEIEELKLTLKISGICSVCPTIKIKEKSFCFTGESNRTKREEIGKLVLSLGGIQHNNVTPKTDYLVIGNNGNPCWAFSCYGRKVEKAMEMRKSGKRIIILHENDFWDAIEDAKIC